MPIADGAIAITSLRASMVCLPKARLIDTRPHVASRRRQVEPNANYEKLELFSLIFWALLKERSVLIHEFDS